MLGLEELDWPWRKLTRLHEGKSLLPGSKTLFWQHIIGRGFGMRRSTATRKWCSSAHVLARREQSHLTVTLQRRVLQLSPECSQALRPQSVCVCVCVCCRRTWCSSLSTVPVAGVPAGARAQNSLTGRCKLWIRALSIVRVLAANVCLSACGHSQLVQICARGHAKPISHRRVLWECCNIGLVIYF